MSVELEKKILGWLSLNPGLFEKIDLKKIDFESEKHQMIFSEFQRQFAETFNVDVFLASERIGGDGMANYISSLTEGLHHLPEDGFKHYVLEFKKRKIAKEFFRESEKQRNLFLKGIDPDFVSIFEITEKIKVASVSAGPSTGLDMARLLDVGMNPVEWLWYPVAPFGMVGTILGNPGVGKTFLLTDLGARVSSGRELPVYRKPTGKTYKGWVIYITSEGVPDKILKPRLHAADADMENVTLVRGIYNEEKEFQVLDVRYHLPLLLDLIRTERKAKKGNCVLVIIDPIASFVSGKANLNDSVQARHALDAIARFAEEASISVLVAVHPNKDETKKIMARAAGSLQMSAAVKTAWIVAEPKDDDPLNMRYFAPYKIQTVEFNKNEALPFYLDDANFEYDGKFFEMARIRWSEKTVKCDVEKIISPRADEGLPQAAKIRAWLKEQMKGGNRPARELYSKAEEEGFSKWQLWRAKASLNIQDMPDGFRGPIIWYLPEDFKE
jgi:hypothetical protein